MKQLLLIVQVLLIFAATNARAADVSAVFNTPVHPDSGLPFHYRGSNNNGVCRVLGYERAAYAVESNSVYESLTVDSSGSVIGGGRSYIYSKIVCLNYIGKMVHETSTLISNPVHANSGLPFHYRGSSNDGVCRALGFQRAAFAVESNSVYESLTVDSSGSVTGGGRNYIYSKIVCLNYVGKTVYETSTRISTPVHPDSGLPFHYRGSSNDGVCRALGFNRAAFGVESNSVYESLTVDSSGSVTGGGRSYIYSMIACIR